ncbi:MFS transporter [Anaerolinea thermophila]|uniref:Major facilitator superfamily transporter n=1 Tax=Anaerolinea thermophila (strain DSM 14523 / JCM 11388 / NBRC 100420 / UNI-1) TaxID=926569 RepID=E8MXR0_ANATU|nr:MFS transporter [Anaerolinea thermophila]BAJ64141.1 major facilitator superfamily transporter [Anaerolinea thermophila UNI-1]
MKITFQKGKTVNLLKKIKSYPRLGVVLLAFVAFVALGLPDGLLGVGWPSIRNSFSIPLDAIGMLLTASVAGYMASSFMSGVMLSRLGVGKVLALSCFLTGLALIGYTLVPQWWMMVLLGIVAGLGAGAIDAGLNTYVAAHFGEGLMQWLHASWGVGITIGPIIMTLGLSSLETWRFGYWVVGGFQIALAIGFTLTLPMWNQGHVRFPAHENAQPEKKLTDYQTPLSETLRKPCVWLSVLLFFLYVGAESSLGTWTYTLLTESRGVDKTLAGFFAGSYWFTFTIGRILAGLVAHRVGINKLVLGGLTGALLGAGLLIWNPAEIANVIAVGLIGISIAPIFPAMMSGTRIRVGDKYAANTIGLQMAATGFGTAVIPSTMGVLARHISLEVIPVYLLAVYVSLLGVYLLAIRPERAPSKGKVQPLAQIDSGK